MKRIGLIIFGIFMCAVACATTYTQYWYVENESPTQTTCTTGGDITLPTAPTKYGYDFIGWERASYTPIEYLESTGTQYVDTGVIGNQDTSTKLVAESLSLVDGIYIFGARTSVATNNYSVQVISAGQWRMGYGTSNGDLGSADTNKHTFYKDKNKQYIDDVLKTTAVTQSFTTPGALILFGGNMNGIVEPASNNLRIYSCKIWDNNILVRDFIPVLDPAGVPCMYDKVEGKFYYNAGTGQFIAGPVVTE